MVERKDVPEQRPERHPGQLAFSIAVMLVWVGASVIVSQLVVGRVMVGLIGSESFARPVPTAIFSALSYILALVMIMAVPFNRAGRKTLGLHGWPTWTDVGLAPVGFVVYFLLAAGLVALFSLFPWFNAEEVQEVGFSYYLSGFDRVVAFLTLVVVAPIAEEIIFRGWLYGRLREKIAAEYSNVVSIVVSSLLVSLLFGLVHMQWNVGVNVFAMSIVLCGLREITGTIYAGILLHILKNGVAFWLLYMM